MEPEKDVVLALDVGGTKLAGALVDDRLEVLWYAESPTPRSPQGGDPALAATAALAEDLRSHAGRRGRRVQGVGAGFPEYVDDKGRLTSREVLAWTEQPCDALAAVCPGVPVAIESDVRCGAIAEWRHGAGKGHPGLFYVALGTGLSAVAIVDGIVVRGARGEAIALGEWDVPARVDATWTGGLESFVSGRGIEHRYAQLTGAEVSTREIAAMAEGGDPAATMLLTSAGNALGMALADVVALLDPPVLVLGGGLGSADTLVRKAVRESYAARTRRRPNPPPLVTAALGPRAGLVGGALVALAARSDSRSDSPA
ncbi:ROK family protein [Actinopolymorpha rutila]|uniref:Glucokinase n=1 Tax=Actinopolymorpha rutila TaxID=446787 RepID=A0A852ZH02_9ACTN|nr:glucokinase [Actinopolymorpha rutila]